MTQRDITPLSPEECLTLLSEKQVGRFLYTDELGPAAVPVNYALAGNEIIFRIEGGQKHTAIGQPTLGFEVDHIDSDSRSGWSVLARGTGREIELERVAEVLHRISGPPPAPWAVGIHNVWLGITLQTVTGRRLGSFRDTSID